MSLWFKYDKTVDARREAKEKEDFLTMNTVATLSGTHPIEKVARGPIVTHTTH